MALFRIFANGLLMDMANITFLNIILAGTGLISLLFFVYAAIISKLEGERRASIVFLWIAIAIGFVFPSIVFINHPAINVISVILMVAIASLVLVYIIPNRAKIGLSKIVTIGKIDERDIMFSRNELESDSDNYKDYYQSNPQRKSVDDKIKDNSGLLNANSGNYDKIMFSSSRASFFTIDALKSKVNGDVCASETKVNPADITCYIKKWAKKLGALDVGITELKDYHIYSHRGRKGNYGKKVELNHKFAIAFTVEMDMYAVRSGPLAPIVMESAQQYLESGAIAVQLAEFIRQLGYPARAHIDGNYEVVCPLVAKDAGLGEIGRMGLLMTPNLGPRVRIAVVTTDLPLNVDKPTNEPSIIDFCTTCKKCAINCPSNAISYNDREEINGVVRWQINQESCFDFWTKSGTDCGRCMSVCPYSHPDNLLHNIVRFGIKNSSIFGRLAVYFDDAIYGKNPTVKNPADWMNIG